MLEAIIIKFSSTPDITQACSLKFSKDAISRNSKLRTLFFTNPTALEEPGGAENYMTNLQKGLNALGNVADFYTGLNSMKDYDLVTFTNSMEYSHLAYLFVKKARSYNKIAVNMPIYWDFSLMWADFPQ